MSQTNQPTYENSHGFHSKALPQEQTRMTESQQKPSQYAQIHPQSSLNTSSSKHQQINQHQSNSVESNAYDRSQSEANSRYINANQNQIANHTAQNAALNSMHQSYQQGHHMAHQHQPQSQSQHQPQHQSQPQHQPQQVKQELRPAQPPNQHPQAVQQQKAQQEQFSAYSQQSNPNQLQSQQQQANAYSDYHRQTPYQPTPSVDFTSVTSVLSYPTPSPSQHSFASSSPSTMTAPSPDVRFQQTAIQPGQQYPQPDERPEPPQRPYSQLSQENQYQIEKMQSKQPYGGAPYANFNAGAAQEHYQSQMLANDKDVLRKYRKSNVKPAAAYAGQGEMPKDSMYGYPADVQHSESTLSYLEKTASSIDESKSAFKATLSNITKPPTPEIPPYASSQSPSFFAAATAKPKPKSRPRAKKAAAQPVVPSPAAHVPQMNEVIKPKAPKEKASKRSKAENAANVYTPPATVDASQSNLIPSSGSHTKSPHYPYSDYHHMHPNSGLATSAYHPHSVSSQSSNSSVTSVNNAPTTNIPSAPTTPTNSYSRSSQQSFSYQTAPATSQAMTTQQIYTNHSKEAHVASSAAQPAVSSSLPSHYSAPQGSMPFTSTASNDLMSSAYASQQHYPPYMGKCSVCPSEGRHNSNANHSIIPGYPAYSSFAPHGYADHQSQKVPATESGGSSLTNTSTNSVEHSARGGSSSAFHKPEEAATTSASSHYNPQHSIQTMASQSSASFEAPSSVAVSHATTPAPSASTESLPTLHSMPSDQRQSIYPLMPPSSHVASAMSPYQQPYYPSQTPGLASAFNYQAPNSYASQAFAPPLQSQYPAGQYPGVAAPSLVSHPYGAHHSAQGGVDPSQYRSYPSAYNYPPYQQPPPGAWFP